jgi:nickel-dependent lactate racemase
MLIEREDISDCISEHATTGAVREFFKQHDYTGKKLLLVIPDNTRSGPVGMIFKMIFDNIGRQTAQLDVLVALGTHQPLSDKQICQRLEISPDERDRLYNRVRFFNHNWNEPDTCVSVGRISADRIDQISGGLFSEEVDVAVNKLLFEYDELFILGPVFPHEVVGFSGGHKYIFPGIAAPEIINFFHWLGAVITNPVINGDKWTPTRKVVEEAAAYIKIPRKLFALVAVENKLKGLFIGDVPTAWEKAADLSSRVHIIYKDKPYNTVLGLAPKMYDDIWTAGKVMYKLEPVVADGGTLIIYAPHITEISYTHGEILDQIGYHTRDYFLRQMHKFIDIPRGVIAHSTHVKGIGTFIHDVEKPRINVVLATGIPQERCAKVNLGYMNPAEINIADYENQEDQGILMVPHAGELLHRLTDNKLF